MKRLVVCCDGTWNTPDQTDRGMVRPTNVVKTARFVADSDPAGVAQKVFYDKGVGTGLLNHLRGGAFGFGLTRNVQDACRFLIRAFEPGDAIFLFGFSRGAYTARSLAGLIRNSGLLRREHAGRLEEAYELYRRRDDSSHPKSDEAQAFRQKYSHEPRIRFVGVWDTVGALGIPGGGLRVFNKYWQFHDVKLSSYVEHAYQALAIDERRGVFQPALWERQEHAAGQVLEQVWFAGVHSNIGGGYADTGLSDLALAWMIGKARACGLAFRDEEVAASLLPDAGGELRDSRVGIYRWMSGRARTIGAAGPGAGESVHESALMRRRGDGWPPYRPANLEDYLRAPSGPQPAW